MPSVHDSAGVRIVESPPAQAAPWRLSAEPLFAVGWDEDGPLFTWPQSGRVLPDGGAMVGEFGEGAIYRLSHDGVVVDTLGRKGEGPGEFQGLDAILLHGDSIVVSDGRLNRLTVITTEGSARTSRYPPGLSLHAASTVLEGGQLLFVPMRAYGPVAESHPGWVFQSRPIVAVSPQGESDTIADLPHLRQWAGTRGGSPGVVQVWGRAGGFPGGFAWARSDRSEVHWHDTEGRLRQIGRWDEEPSPLSQQFRDEVRRRTEEAFSSRGERVVAEQLAQTEEWLDRHDAPLPYWRQLFVDRAGNVWLSEYSMSGEPFDRWRVLTRDGTFLGWIDVPGVVRILDITEDRTLVVRHDELDVPAVLMFELIKS